MSVNKKNKLAIWRYKKWMIIRNGIIIILPQSWKKQQAEEVFIETTGEGEITIKPVRPLK